jgi:hypothetical protein
MNNSDVSDRVLEQVKLIRIDFSNANQVKYFNWFCNYFFCGISNRSNKIVLISEFILKNSRAAIL